MANVRNKTDADGGRPIYGWAFIPKTSLEHGDYWTAMHHAVWQPPGRNTVIDITPFHPTYRPYMVDTSIIFLADPEANPVTIGNGIAPLPTQFFPASENNPALFDHLDRSRLDEQARCQAIYSSLRQATQ